MRGLTMLRAVSNLSVFLLLLLVSVPAQALSAESDLLNSDSFSTSTSSSMWLVEFFSPYCPHCKRFKPTWENLVSLHGHLADSSGFNFARVNCIEQGGESLRSMECPALRASGSRLAKAHWRGSNPRPLQQRVHQGISDNHAVSRRTSAQRVQRYAQLFRTSRRPCPLTQTPLFKGTVLSSGCLSSSWPMLQTTAHIGTSRRRQQQ